MKYKRNIKNTKGKIEKTLNWSKSTIIENKELLCYNFYIIYSKGKKVGKESSKRNN
jgi:hypothetical protein